MTVHTAHLRRALARLERADARLRAHAPEPRSLAPSRPLATPLAALGRALLTPDVSAERADAFADALCGILDAQLVCFPENIFWDSDCMAAALSGLPTAEAIARDAAQIVALQRGFGRGSVINFRYVHDFIYGYDWARWVRRAPDARAAHGPFSAPFLAYLRARCGELVALIARDDAVYGQLPPGQPRNPFGFSREPDDERRLHEALAAQGLIPVEAWAVEARMRWDRPFREVRAEQARAMGIAAHNGAR